MTTKGTRILLFGLLSAGVAASVVLSYERAPKPLGRLPETQKAPPRQSCYPPRGEPLPAQRVLRDLMDGRDVELQGRIIDGSLDADLVFPSADDRKTTLRVIPGRLRLESCRITGRLAFPRCVLPDIGLSCTEVLGDVDLTEADLRGGLAAERSRIVGDVRLTRLSAENDVSFKDATLEGGLEVTNARMHGLSLSGADIARDVDVSRSVVSSLDFGEARIGGGMKLDDLLVLRGISARQAAIERGLTMVSIRVGGSLDLSESAGKSAFSLSDVSITGSLMLPLASLTPLSITGTSVGQNFLMLDGQFGDVAMESLRVHGPTEFAGAHFSGRVSLIDCDFGKSFSASQSTFDGDTEFRKVVFPGEDPLSGALFARAPTLVDTAVPVPPIATSDDEGTDDDPDATPLDDSDDGSDDEPEAAP